MGYIGHFPSSSPNCMCIAIRMYKISIGSSNTSEPMINVLPWNYRQREKKTRGKKLRSSISDSAFECQYELWQPFALSFHSSQIPSLHRSHSAQIFRWTESIFYVYWALFDQFMLCLVHINDISIDKIGCFPCEWHWFHLFGFIIVLSICVPKLFIEIWYEL